MKTINISDDKKRDSVVSLESKIYKSKVNYILSDGQKPEHVKIIKETSKTRLKELIKKAGSIDDVAKLIIETDEEIDMKSTGKILSNTQRVYLKSNGEIAYAISYVDVVFDNQGQEKERKNHLIQESNIATEIPLRWTGKKFPKKEIIKKFIFQKKYQIIHTNGLTFDFLYNIAKSLHESQSMVLLGAGSKGNEPLILNRGGKPYYGFLEGRIENGKYCLILHVTNLELKEIGQ